jgi:hypothetical protein
MDAQSYSLRREHNRWIVGAAGNELMACADKRTALRIIRAATALKDDRALSNSRAARTSSTPPEGVPAVRSQMPTRL